MVRPLPKYTLQGVESPLTKLLKIMATALQGLSKGEGVEDTINCNHELASFLRPGFQKWYATHADHLRDLQSALPLCIDRLYYETVDLMNKSAAIHHC